MIKKIFLGFTLLSFPFGKMDSSTFSHPINQVVVQEKYVPSVSLRLDNNFSEYEEDFATEKFFWTNLFILDSVYSLVYEKKTMKILMAINTPPKRTTKILLDSIYQSKKINKWKNPLGIMTGRRNQGKDATKRAFKHLDYIIDSLEAHCLPNNLAALPFVESEFKTDVCSYAGAVGMWQFMNNAARENGLKVNWKIDERKNPKKALEAFIKYMGKANERFESPLLALVSYNVGINSKYFKYKKTKSDVEIVKSMGFAPRNYFPSFLAGLEILKDPLKYYPELEGEL